jgi:hypothetical protein
MTVIIGVDPHKASHTAVAISDGEEEVDRKKVRAGGAQLSQPLRRVAAVPVASREPTLGLFGNVFTVGRPVARRLRRARRRHDL